MTDKDLHKLSREDLLKLMLAQSREVNRQKEQISRLQEESEQANETLERLKGRLNEKDETIERLKGKLNDKDLLLEKLKQRLDQKDVLLEKQQQELEGKREQSPGLDEHVILLQNDNASLRRQVTEMSVKLAEQTALLENKTEALAQLQERLAEAEASENVDALEDLDLLLEEFNEKNTALKQQLDAREAQLETLCRQLSEQESSGEQLQRALADLRESLRAGGSQTVDTQAFSAELHREFAALRSSLTGQVEPAAGDAQERLLEKEKQVQALTAKLEDRDNEIRELWSRIWLLVAPKA